MSVGAGELRSEFVSTVGGVMTEEAGAVTGDLELLTRPTPDGRAIEAFVRYAGAEDLYTVCGSPVRAISGRPDAGEHRTAHERILVALTTLRGVEGGNELPTDETSPKIVGSVVLLVKRCVLPRNDAEASSGGQHPRFQ